MADINVTITPSSGEQIKLAATGNSVAEVLQSAGREAKNMNIFVNGQVASLDTHVKEGDTVHLAERPKGS